MKDKKIVLPGGAGLVGQNLVARLLARGYTNLVVIDKHAQNLAILRNLQPSVVAIEADLSEPGPWKEYFAGASSVVILQAQIGGLVYEEFLKNNVEATRHILEAINEFQVPHYVHISSSVVVSVADDFYTRSKILQEKLVIENGPPCAVLRPTLMFGWFDRKHLGWLSRFMKRTPVFPIPGNGKFMRQPLYVGDFCNVIISCIENRVSEGVYNISGHEKVDYIDIIRQIRDVTGTKTAVVKIPYWFFYFLLWFWALFDKKPPFTTQQLEALVAKDEFEVTDWPQRFGVSLTPFTQALKETFTDPKYSSVELEF